MSCAQGWADLSASSTPDQLANSVALCSNTCCLSNFLLVPKSKAAWFGCLSNGFLWLPPRHGLVVATVWLKQKNSPNAAPWSNVCCVGIRGLQPSWVCLKIWRFQVVGVLLVPKIRTSFYEACPNSVPANCAKIQNPGLGGRSSPEELG